MDRSLGGKRLVDLLRRVGISAEAHMDHYTPNAPDWEWIPDATNRGWVIFTSDGRICTDPMNVQAVYECGARIIVTTTNGLPEVWGAALIVGVRAIRRLLATGGPLVIMLGREAASHVRKSDNNKGRISHTRSKPAGGSTAAQATDESFEPEEE